MQGGRHGTGKPEHMTKEEAQTAGVEEAKTAGTDRDDQLAEDFREWTHGLPGAVRDVFLHARAACLR